jgi:hypothetical protein
MANKKSRADRDSIFALADVFADQVWRDFLAGMKEVAPRS